MAKLSEFEFNDNQNERELKNRFDLFKNMSKDQLENELVKEVARQKGNGSFDFEGLSNMVESLRGVLPENQFNNIKRILENLK